MVCRYDFVAQISDASKALLGCSRRRAEVTHEALVGSPRIQTADNKGPET